MATDIRDQEFSNNQEYLHRFIVTASHKATAYEEIWFDDKKAWSTTGGVTSDFAGYLTVTPILEGSAANAINLSSRMGATRRYTGLAYIYLRFKLTGNSKKAESPFAQSIPSRVTIIGKGAPTYDPRLDSTVAGGSGAHRAADQTTWAWNDAASRNPALQLLWYLLGWRIKNPVTNEWRLAVGKGIPASRIDLASFITAANLCDEPVTLAAGGTQPRYRSDCVFSESDATGTVLDQLKAAMNAELDDVDGKIRITVLHNDLATPIADFNDDDILSGFSWDQTAPLDETYNVVRGTFIDPSTTSLYQSVEYPEVRIDSADGIDRVETVDFQTVQDASQAQRLVKQRIARMLYSGRFTATFSYRAWKVQKNDVVRLTFGALGWTNKLFRVVETAVQVDGQVPMVLQVENADIYLWDRDERPAIQPVQPTSYDPYLNPIYQDVVEPKYADGVTIDELRPAEPGATAGASPEERDLLAELDADIAQAEIDIAAAQQTIADLQADAAATETALTQAQNDILAQGAEIQAAQGDIIANATAISTVSSTVSSQGASITSLQQTASGQAGQISTLQQTVSTQGASITSNATAITNLQGSVSTLSQTVSTQGGQISTNATAITTLQGTVSSLSTTVSTQGASITSLQTASTTQAGQIATQTLRLNAETNPNLLVNGSFENGINNWQPTGNWAAVPDGVWGSYAYTVSIPDGAARILNQSVNIGEGVVLTISADFSLGGAAGIGGTGAMYVDAICVDAGGNALLDSPQVTVSSGDFDPTGASRQANKTTFTTPANTARVIARVVAQRFTGTMNFNVRQVKLERGSQATSYSGEASVTQVYSAIYTTTTQVASLQTTVSTHGASITSNSTAITTLQTQTASLTMQVTSGNPNLLQNSTFQNGFSAWTAHTSYAFNIGNTGAWGTYAVTSTNASDPTCYIYQDVAGPENDWYTATADMGMFLSGSGAAGVSWVEIQWLDSTRTQVLGVGRSAFRSYGNNFDPTGAARQALKCTSQNTYSAPWLRVVYYWQRSGGNVSSYHIRQCQLVRGSVLTPYSQEATVLQAFSALSTLTTQYASLSTTVSTQGVTITSQQTAITTINNNVTTLYGRAALTIEAGGVITGWEVNNNGTTGDIKLRADRVSVVTATGGTKTFEIRQGTIIGYYPNGQKMYQLGDQSVA